MEAKTSSIVSLTHVLSINALEAFKKQLEDASEQYSEGQTFECTSLSLQFSLNRRFASVRNYSPVALDA